jgi:hypothetical protein
LSQSAVLTRVYGRVRTAGWWWAASLGLTAAAGIALRVWTYRSALGVPDSDEAVVGLMVRHVLHGQVTTFFWGQAYGGSQEVLLTAPVFWLFGSSWLALRLVPIVLVAAASAVVWRVGRRTIGEPGATLAAALFWIWPAFALYKTTHQWGFYASGLLYCALLLLLSLRIVEEPTTFNVGAFGLIVGLSLWEDEQLIPVVLAAVAWTIWRRPRSLRLLWIALPLAVLGALPWLIWNIGHDWGSFHSPIADTTTYQHRLRIFASPLLPMMLGLRAPFSQQSLAGSVTLVAYGVLLVLFVVAGYRTRRRDVSLLYVVAIVYPFVYAISPQTLFDQEPRYLMVLAPVLVLLVAQLARSHAWAVGVVAAALAVSVVTLHRMERYFETVPSDPPAAPRDLSPLVATLDRFHVDRVYADFWLAYRLTFDTDERIVAAQNKFTRLRFVGDEAIASPHPFIRYRPYETEVNADPHHGFVFFQRGSARVRPLMRELARHGYRRTVVEGFFVYTPPAGL